MTRLCIIGAVLCAAALAALPAFADPPVVLTLTMAYPDQPQVQIVAGLMNGPEFCAVTGRLLVADLTAANPGLTVTFACAPYGEAA
ncbi:hypothetical protein [Neotabrizicola sp. VNH66]|uniref:hypothetical protein n=1 Tax=Neotabrizicola sp. VNH66 TaxID=3400918 RepID=UPI003C0E7DDC